EIDHTTIVQGQNGLMLARSDNARIWNNTFSYLSGLGLAPYRASGNRIMHNKVDWCVRGYSHTFYNRGQDSAGILIYEQSTRNIEAIAIEHGQDNKITENRFDGDETAIRLWKNATQDPDWEYPKKRDTRSRDYVIAGNTFVGNATALKITETQDVRVLTNGFE